MSEFYHAILSDRPEDQKKAVEWAKEEQARIKHDKGEEDRKWNDQVQIGRF